MAKTKAKTKTHKEEKPLEPAVLTRSPALAFLNFFLKKPLGRFLLGLTLVVALFFLNLLISRDQLETFTLLCGLELLLAIFISWGLFIYRRRKQPEERQDESTDI